MIYIFLFKIYVNESGPSKYEGQQDTWIHSMLAVPKSIEKVSQNEHLLPTSSYPDKKKKVNSQLSMH